MKDELYVTPSGDLAVRQVQEQGDVVEDKPVTTPKPKAKPARGKGK